MVRSLGTSGAVIMGSLGLGHGWGNSNPMITGAPGPSQRAARRPGPVPAARPPRHAGGLPTNVL